MLTLSQCTRGGPRVKGPPGEIRPGFSAIPHDLRLDPRIKPRDLQLVASLLSFARAKATCYPSNGRLASEMRCGPRTVQLCLRRLAEAGWVRIGLGADNPTGRLITLTWREADCAPPSPPISSRVAPTVAPERFAEKGREKERSGVGLAKEVPPSPSGQMEEASRAELFALAEGADPFLGRWARKLLASHHPAQPEPTLAELHQWADDASNPALQSIARKRLASIEPALAVGTRDVVGDPECVVTKATQQVPSRDVGAADTLRLSPKGIANDNTLGTSKSVARVDTLRPRSTGGAEVSPPCPTRDRGEGTRLTCTPTRIAKRCPLDGHHRPGGNRRSALHQGRAQSALLGRGPQEVRTLGVALSKLLGRGTT